MSARRSWFLRGLALGAVITASCVLIGGRNSPAAPPQPQLVAASGSAAPPAVTRTSGDSQIDIPGGDPTGVGAALRGCPAAVDQAQAQQTSVTCLPIDRLANHTLVTMRCWVDATGPYAIPAGFSSPRWFYVTEVNGLHPGYSGYLYSDMIPPAQQIITPLCTSQILARYPFYGPRPSPAPLTLAIIGSCTTNGGTLTSRTSGFLPGATYFITATYPDGSVYPGLSAERVTARPNGSVPWHGPAKATRPVPTRPRSAPLTAVTPPATSTSRSARPRHPSRPGQRPQRQLRRRRRPLPPRRAETCHLSRRPRRSPSTTR